ncbi:MAG: DUF2059 domain-containing protein [Candidatus Acidiferrales bacterium]
MKVGIALFALPLLLTAHAFAQAPPAAQQNPPAQHQPGTLANPPQVPATPQAAPPAAAPEKPDPAKEAAIRHVMDLMGTSKLGDQITSATTTQVRTFTSRSIPPDRQSEFMDRFSQKFKQLVPPERINNAAIAIYASHFSLEDLQGIAQFYESPVGQRVTKVLPQVYQESEAAGMQIVRKEAMEILRGMTDDYPELKAKLPPDNSKPAPAPAPAPSAAPAPGPAPAPAPPAAPTPAPAPHPAPPPK